MELQNEIQDFIRLVTIVAYGGIGIPAFAAFIHFVFTPRAEKNS